MEKKQPIIELKHIKKCYTKDVPVIYDFNLTINEGEFVTFLGPSGCGKTTILRMLAGFETPTSGEILFNGKDISELPPNERKFNTVFQKYALFPHLNIYDNISFGLKEKKVPKNEIKKKVKRVLEIVDLEGFEKRKIDSLSGGQQQRIAIARAIVNEPRILLLDEPLSALDYKMRQEMQIELKNMHKELGITFIFVTHDQDEAIEVADEIIITNEGRVEQMGDPVEIYLHPKTPFVAQFIGKSSIIEEYGKLKGFDSIGSDTRAIIRPEFVEIKSLKDVTEQSSIYEQAAVEQSIFRGNYFEVLLNIKGITIRTNSPLVNGPLKSGDKVWVVINQMYVFDDKTTTTLTNKGLDVSSMYYI